MSRRVGRETSRDAANLESTTGQLAQAAVEASEGPTVAETLAALGKRRREHNKRRQSIAELMSAQQDAAEMDRELSALGSRVNNRRLAFGGGGGGGGNMRDRMAQAQRRTATAFLTGDDMMRAAQMAALAEMAPAAGKSTSNLPRLGIIRGQFDRSLVIAEATDSSSSSEESSPENSSEEEEQEVDPDAWKKDMEVSNPHRIPT